MSACAVWQAGMIDPNAGLKTEEKTAAFIAGKKLTLNTKQTRNYKPGDGWKHGGKHTA